MILLELKYLLENIKKSENKKELESEAYEKLKKLIPFDYEKLREENEKNMEKIYGRLKEKNLLREKELKPTETIIEKTQKRYKGPLGKILSKIFGKRKEE
jgi:hypothetical protein